MRKVLVTLLLGVAVLAHTPAASAQHPQTREGFWLNVGLGVGSLGCDNCGSRESALSGQFSLGGTLSQNVYLGVGTNGWTKSEGAVTLSAGTLTALVRLYPSKTGGFFVTAGLGYGRVDLDVSGFGGDSRSGSGAVLGLGYDVRIGRNVSLTPFWNGFAMKYDGGDANVGQLGISLTVH